MDNGSIPWKYFSQFVFLALNPSGYNASVEKLALNISFLRNFVSQISFIYLIFFFKIILILKVKF